MDKRIKLGLDQDRIIDITTNGRKTGTPRRIEIWFFNIANKIFITGTPGARDWYANVLANPEIIFHLKHSVQADIPAICMPITAIEERRLIFLSIFHILNEDRNLKEYVEHSPLIEVNLNLANAFIY